MSESSTSADVAHPENKNAADAIASRRTFLTVVAAAAAAAACAACMGSADTAAAAPPTSAPATGPIDLGAASDFKADGINANFARSQRIFVVRHENKIFACDARCTHQNAILNVKGDAFVCPKHRSEFSIEGTVTKAPAQNSLARYAITKDDKGHLLVDLNKSFREKNWGDAESFVTVS